MKCEPGKGPYFFEINIKKGSRNDLGRPKNTPKENISSLIKHLRD